MGFKCPRSYFEFEKIFHYSDSRIDTYWKRSESDNIYKFVMALILLFGLWHCSLFWFLLLYHFLCWLIDYELFELSVLISFGIHTELVLSIVCVHEFKHRNSVLSISVIELFVPDFVDCLVTLPFYMALTDGLHWRSVFVCRMFWSQEEESAVGKHRLLNIGHFFISITAFTVFGYSSSWCFRFASSSLAILIEFMYYLPGFQKKCLNYAPNLKLNYFKQVVSIYKLMVELFLSFSGWNSKYIDKCWFKK